MKNTKNNWRKRYVLDDVLAEIEPFPPDPIFKPGEFDGEQSLPGRIEPGIEPRSSGWQRITLAPSHHRSDEEEIENIDPYSTQKSKTKYSTGKKNEKHWIKWSDLQ
jgi:hypothetical protein